MTPILFSGPMVCAILERRKTQTRRLASSPLAKRKPGDVLWVRERVRVDQVGYFTQPIDGYAGYVEGTYRADDAKMTRRGIPDRLKPMSVGECMSMGCFKGAHRIELVVKRVWIEPLQAISDEDALAEGICHAGSDIPAYRRYHCAGFIGHTPRDAYSALWNSLHTKKGERWTDNPDVVALEFERVA